MNRYAWTRVTSLSQALAVASTTVAEAMSLAAGAKSGTRIAVLKAGGIDLLDLLKEHLLAPDLIVSLKDVPGLDAIVAEDGGGWRIGAMVTLAQLAKHPILRERYAALSDAVSHSASPQIRNVASIGGNLLQRPRCWYFRSAQSQCRKKGGNTCFALLGQNQYHAIFANRACAIVHPSTAASALVALGAMVELTSAEGVVRRMLLENFFLSPDRDMSRENDLRSQEILTAVLLPPLPANMRTIHLRQGEKDAFDWSLAEVAVAVELNLRGLCQRASIILGAVAPVPYRATMAEAALLGKKINPQVAATAARAALDGAAPLARNAYKLPLLETLVRRAILALVTHV
jgi:xanthine dehydrogenase YagS FAD-binding subunit